MGDQQVSNRATRLVALDRKLQDAVCKPHANHKSLVQAAEMGTIRDLRTCSMHQPKSQIFLVQQAQLKWVVKWGGLGKLEHVDCVGLNAKKSCGVAVVAEAGLGAWGKWIAWN